MLKNIVNTDSCLLFGLFQGKEYVLENLLTVTQGLNMPVTRLTETGVERAKPDPDKRIEFADSVVPGLILRISSKGHKSWTFLFRFGRKQFRMGLGSYPAISLKKARAQALSARQDIALGVNPKIKREEEIKKQIQEEEKTKTVREFSVEYIERDAKPKNRRWKGTQQSFDKYILPAIGHMEVDKVMDLRH